MINLSNRIILSIYVALVVMFSLYAFAMFDKVNGLFLAAIYGVLSIYFWFNQSQVSFKLKGSIRTKYFARYSFFVIALIVVKIFVSIALSKISLNIDLTSSLKGTSSGMEIATYMFFVIYLMLMRK